MKRISDKQKIELSLRKRIKAELIKKQLETFGYVFCVRCGKKADWRGIQLRHKVALSRGGLTTKENTELSCAKCHFVKDHLIHEVEELKKYWD